MKQTQSQGSSQQSQQSQQPAWWGEQHQGNWDRVREALRRDWEQTKADLSDRGADLNQDVGHTVRQATGQEPLPATYARNVDVEQSARVPDTQWEGSGSDPWDTIEPAVRFGAGARSQYHGHEDWSPELERQLSADWEETGSTSTWESIKGHVRRGWQSVKEAVS